MKKIIILDFLISEVFIYNYDPSIYKNEIEFFLLDEIPHLHTNCEWMIVDNLIINNK